MEPTGPIDAGGDLERLLKELQSKGWPAKKVQAAREVWEEVCHDPMRRGRGGKGIPENERPQSTPTPLNPIKPDLTELFNRTVSWPAEPPEPPEPPPN
jgi:hypothetical protein